MAVFQGVIRDPYVIAWAVAFMLWSWTGIPAGVGSTILCISCAYFLVFSVPAIVASTISAVLSVASRGGSAVLAECISEVSKWRWTFAVFSAIKACVPFAAPAAPAISRQARPQSFTTSPMRWLGTAVATLPFGVGAYVAYRIYHDSCATKDCDNPLCSTCCTTRELVGNAKATFMSTTRDMLTPLLEKAAGLIEVFAHFGNISSMFGTAAEKRDAENNVRYATNLQRSFKFFTEGVWAAYRSMANAAAKAFVAAPADPKATLLTMHPAHFVGNPRSHMHQRDFIRRKLNSGDATPYEINWLMYHVPKLTDREVRVIRQRHSAATIARCFKLYEDTGDRRHLATLLSKTVCVPNKLCVEWEIETQELDCPRLMKEDRPLPSLAFADDGGCEILNDAHFELAPHVHEAEREEPQAEPRAGLGSPSDANNLWDVECEDTLDKLNSVPVEQLRCTPRGLWGLTIEAEFDDGTNVIIGREPFFYIDRTLSAPQPSVPYHKFRAGKLHKSIAFSVEKQAYVALARNRLMPESIECDGVEHQVILTSEPYVRGDALHVRPFVDRTDASLRSAEARRLKRVACAVDSVTAPGATGRDDEELTAAIRDLVSQDAPTDAEGHFAVPVNIDDAIRLNRPRHRVAFVPAEAVASTSTACEDDDSNPRPYTVRRVVNPRPDELVEIQGPRRAEGESKSRFPLLFDITVGLFALYGAYAAWRDISRNNRIFRDFLPPDDERAPCHAMSGDSERERHLQEMADHYSEQVEREEADAERDRSTDYDEYETRSRGGRARAAKARAHETARPRMPKDKRPSNQKQTAREKEKEFAEREQIRQEDVKVRAHQKFRKFTQAKQFSALSYDDLIDAIDEGFQYFDSSRMDVATKARFATLTAELEARYLAGQPVPDEHRIYLHDYWDADMRKVLTPAWNAADEYLTQRIFSLAPESKFTPQAARFLGDPIINPKFVDFSPVVKYTSPQHKWLLGVFQGKNGGPAPGGPRLLNALHIGNRFVIPTHVHPADEKLPLYLSGADVRCYVPSTTEGQLLESASLEDGVEELYAVPSPFRCEEALKAAVVQSGTNPAYMVRMYTEGGNLRYERVSGYLSDSGTFVGPPTRLGDCGSPYFQDFSGQPRVVGVHIAATVPFSREEPRAFCSLFTPADVKLLNSSVPLTLNF